MHCNLRTVAYIEDSILIFGFYLKGSLTPLLLFVNCKTNILQKTTHYSRTPLRFPGIASAWATFTPIGGFTGNHLCAFDGLEMVIVHAFRSFKLIVSRS